MLSDEAKELIAERLANRIEKLNTFILKEIANDIDELGRLSPSKAFKLANIMKYGGNYHKIVQEIQKVTKLNKQEIEKILDSVAEQQYIDAKQYYQLKNKGYIPYRKNKELKQQVEALKKITAEEYMNFSRTKVLGYSIKDKDNKLIFKDVSNAYREAIDDAVVSIYQGKEDFDRMFRKTILDFGNSGLKTVDYESGRTRRLDSAVRMNIQGAIRDLQNTVELEIGKQTDCDGIELSVHENPAPDHEPVQGHQFKLEEFEKLQGGVDSFKDVDGEVFEPIKRHIGQYNCQHNIFSITVGVDEPNYTKEELRQIIENNHKKVEIDGKEYTKYECTQLQRRLETEVRKQKDIQIMAREGNKEDIINEAQRNITQLTQKYKEISQKAGIPTQMERMRVSGYKRINVRIKEPIVKPKEPTITKGGGMVSQVQPKLGYEEVVKVLEKKNVGFDLGNLDERAMVESLNEVNDVINDYPLLKKSIKDRKYEILDSSFGGNIYMKAGSKYMSFNTSKYKNGNYENLLKEYQDDMMLGSDGSIGWHYKVNDEDAIKSIASHELGHTIEFRYIRDIKGERFKDGLKKQDNVIMNSIYFRAKQNSGLETKELRKKYLTGYGRSKRNFEAFAEIFSGMRNGVDNPLTKAMREWLDEFYK